MNALSARLRTISALDPNAMAVEFQGQAYSWGQLTAIAGKLDALLNSAGLGQGAAIGVVLSNRPGIVGVLIGLLMSERCVLFINPHYPAEALSAELRDLKAAAVVADETVWQGKDIAGAVKETGGLGIQVTNDGAVTALPGLDFLGRGPFHSVDAGVAMEILTSGTTGRPKRIQTKYSTLADAILSSVRDEEGGPTLKRAATIATAPLVHVSGLFNVLYPFCEGRPIALLEKFTVQGWVDAVKRHKIRYASLPPTGVAMVMEANVPREDLSSLVALRCGTAPLPPERQVAFEERYGVPILIQYSATEWVGGVAGWGSPELHKKYMPAKLGSIGRAVKGIRLRVVDPDTGAELPPNQMGLLEVLPEKRLGPDATWTRTTDLARIDEDGFVFLAGRADDVIIRGGFKLHLPTIQDVIEKHPAVAEASIIGLPDARLGQVPVCAVEPRPGHEGLTAAEIEAFARANLTAYQVPLKFMVVLQLPRTVSMKVARPGVKALFEGAA
jgi:acyl-coenzyme A synthetase/AMP-(fatty) acid ligase